MKLLSRVKKLEHLHTAKKPKIKFIDLLPGEEFKEENYPDIYEYEIVIIDDVCSRIENVKKC